jgi:hypothetical protein
VSRDVGLRADDGKSGVPGNAVTLHPGVATRPAQAAKTTLFAAGTNTTNPKKALPATFFQ